ncbi:UDP-N-acetylmuramate dehydrogenase [Aureibacter tunicatorum]|uniref:UDP-N-acetylenolpyruvoylglucosamine reductase n=1 Tax=Aureibacter tunicatorum TaxID=866807 RepID=A0AAE3XKW3_9BACT|nr:UDP-N-acetylmuramate dehydrogenase [Aureibacter tunicatorum]MDR6238400.1 UDP-N-acetylmuramate dehydrogenase [Aureibacter tunicatorum]BDD03432.1 UDP-N-acetylenolpyruvoylglucosamine reductase [Aureibacter tunicatorum]
MQKIKSNHPLLEYNTFGIPVLAKYFAEVSSLDELLTVLKSEEAKENPIFLLGGGSNILLTQPVDSLVIYNNIKGIEVVAEDDEFVYVKSGGGEVWHELVLYCVENGWGGLENLSLIPGKVGTSPIQNIGAYGVELKDVFMNLRALNLETLEVEGFEKEACDFGYRSSVFKKEKKGKYFILDVAFKLRKNPELNVSYGAIREELINSAGDNEQHWDIADVSSAVMKIRQSKLPDPAVIGNGGSFFKNPVVSNEQFCKLTQAFADIPSYKVDDFQVKVPAGWLIEKAGWKGYKEGNIGVHEKQALVLVNFGGNNGKAIKNLAEKIQKSVFEKFEIEISPEVNIY